MICLYQNKNVSIFPHVLLLFALKLYNVYVKLLYICNLFAYLIVQMKFYKTHLYYNKYVSSENYENGDSYFHLTIILVYEE